VALIVGVVLCLRWKLPRGDEHCEGRGEGTPS
jgi:hypothetical protein